MRRTLALCLTVATTAAGLSSTSALAAPTLTTAGGTEATHIVVLDDDASGDFASIAEQLRAANITISHEWPGLGMMAIEASTDTAARVAQIDGVKGTGEDQTVFAPPVTDVITDRTSPEESPDSSPSDLDDLDAQPSDVNYRRGETRRNAAWGLDRIDQENNYLDGKYVAPNNGEGVTAYIIDSGMDLNHPEFAGRVKPGYDFVDDDYVPQDENNHGTHVAGTVGGENYGVANEVTLVPVRVLNETAYGTGSAIVDGIDWVRRNHSGPSVANISIGAEGGNWWLDEASQRLVESGVFVSVSAMNWDIDACNVSPARISDVMTVGAITSNDRRAGYSDWGTCVDIMAPGSNIQSARIGGGWMRMSGTSMAAPHVTGVAAQYLAVHPNASPAEITRALSSNAVDANIADLKGSPDLLLNNTFLINEDVPRDRPGTNPIPEPEPTWTPTPRPTPVTDGQTYSASVNAPVNYSDSVKTTFDVRQNSVETAALGLDISHPCQEDLQVNLTTPEGHRTVAKRASWSWACTPWNGMQTETFDVRSNRSGEWTVDVKDYRYQNDGTVQAIELTVS